MQLLKLSLSLVCLLSTPLALSDTLCPSDQALRNAQFKIHPSETFDQLADTIVNDFLNAGDSYIYDTAGPIRSVYSDNKEASLVLFSYDDITTPRDTQFGDIVLVLEHDPQGQSKMGDLRKVSSYTPNTDASQGRLVEVRWWDQGVRQVVYNKRQINCATHSLPMAENALF